MRRLIIITLILLCCLNLTLEAKQNKAKLLQSNLRQWEQFRWDGIIQVQSSLLSLRKNFVLVKDKDELRLDILDSGIMGLQAKPMVTAYLKDKIILEAPTVKQLSNLDLNWFIPAGAVGSLLHFTDSLLVKSREIVADRKAETTGTLFTFDKKYRLSGISNPDLVLQASIIYNNHNQPTKMLIKHAGEEVAEFQINQQTYTGISIEPLLDGTDTIEPDKLEEEIFPEEPGLNELNLNDLKLGDLLDSLKISGLKLKDLKLDGLKYGAFKLDGQNWGDIKLKDLLDSLKLGDLKLKDLKLDSLNFKSPGLDSLNFHDLDLGKYLDNLDLQGLDLDSLNLEDLNLEELLKGLDLKDLNLENLDLNNLNLNGLNLEEMLQGLKLEDLNLEDLQSEAARQGM
jgi:hypothetical protein